MKRFLIKGATVCDKNRLEIGDVRIIDGKIDEVMADLTPDPGEEVIEADGLHLLPGLIDLNVRIKDDSLTLQNLEKLSLAALCGGLTQAILMPDSNPAIDSEAVVEFVTASAMNRKGTVISPICNGINTHNELTDMSILIKQGCLGIYSPSALNGNLLRRIFEYGSMWDVPLFCRCEDITLSGSGVMNEGFVSSKLGLPGIPAIAETKEVAKLGEIALSTDAPLVFQSLSSERSLQITSKTKQEGGRVFSEVSIHHLSLTEKACEKFNTAAKIKPPLKSEATRQKLIESLKRGQVDLLTSAHSAKSVTKKDLAFEEASFGINAIESYFSLLYTFLVRGADVSLSQVAELASYNPAHLLKQETKGLIEPGYDADLILVDLKSSKKVKSVYSPYRYEELFGSVKWVFIGGEKLELE